MNKQQKIDEMKLNIYNQTVIEKKYNKSSPIQKLAAYVAISQISKLIVESKYNGKKLWKKMII